MRTVPKGQHKTIERWIKNWREVQQLLEQLSELQWQQVDKMKKK